MHLYGGANGAPVLCNTCCVQVSQHASMFACVDATSQTVSRNIEFPRALVVCTLAWFSGGILVAATSKAQCSTNQPFVSVAMFSRFDSP